MKKRILPVTVSTLEALTFFVQEGCRLVYMQWLFFEGYRAEILHSVFKQHYKLKFASLVVWGGD